MCDGFSSTYPLLPTKSSGLACGRAEEASATQKASRGLYATVFASWRAFRKLIPPCAEYPPFMRFWLRHLIQPYRFFLLVVLLAMLLETAVSLAEPWPLKIILDNVVGTRHLPGCLAHLIGQVFGGANPKQIAVVAAMSAIAVAAIGGLASYLDNYFTEIVAQHVAHDLRTSTYHHLQRLSMSYYHTHQVGALVSTLTTDIATIQGFASSGVLDILVDLLTVIGMFALMFWLNSNFALVAALLAPFLLFFGSRFKRAVKRAAQEVRKNEAATVAVELEGLQAQRVVQAFAAEDAEDQRLQAASATTLESALKTRRVKSLLAPLTALAASAGTPVVPC